MANKRTRAVSEEEFFLLLDTINNGFITKDGKRVHGNPQISMILTLQGNLGLRISDCINLKLSDIVKDAGRYRLNIVEKKTGKKREFTIPEEVYNYILRYMSQNIRYNSFKEWIVTYKNVDSPMGDFAGDVDRVKDYPAEETYERLLQYFEFQSRMHANPIVLDMFKRAWNFFETLN